MLYIYLFTIRVSEIVYSNEMKFSIGNSKDDQILPISIKSWNHNLWQSKFM